MIGPVSRVTTFVVLTACLTVGAARTASAQACPGQTEVGTYQSGGTDWGVVPGLLKFPVTVEADLRALGGTRPGGTWRMPTTDGFLCDGLAFESVSFTRLAEPEFGSMFHTYDVVVDLRARPRGNNMTADLEFVVIDGDRRLRLGSFGEIRILAGEATRVSRTFSISDADFLSYFAAGKAPTLRVVRSIFEGC